MLSASQLRHVLEVRVRPNIATGRHGGKKDAWVMENVVRASIEPLTGRELLNAQQTEARVSHRIRTFWFPDMSPDKRLRLRPGGRVFRPSTIINVGEQDREFEILATEKPD